jgi:hypothetical protein
MQCFFQLALLKLGTPQNGALAFPAMLQKIFQIG